MANVFLNLLRILSRRVYVVPSAPELPISVTLEEKEEAEDAMRSLNNGMAALWVAVKKDDLAHCAQFCMIIKKAAILAACELIQTAAMAQKTLNTVIQLKEAPDDVHS